jgi:IclR family transcriptional regulator, acetate operon repressor
LLQKERRGSYSLGLIYINFYKTINNQLYFRNTFMPYLADLSEKVNEQIVIAYANGLNDPFAEVFTDNTLVKKHMLNVTPDSSGKVPLHVSSLGKIILADLNEEEIKGYFENKEFKKTTPNTITDYQVMREHLTRIRQDCIAFDDEEYQSGIRSLAAGIRDGNGKIIAAIGVIAPSVRMTYLKMQELTSVVRDCAMEISRALGFKS